MKTIFFRLIIGIALFAMPIITMSQTVITAPTEDGFVSDPAIITSNNPWLWNEMKVGKSAVDGSANLTSGVIPFQLPAIPAGKEITDASLSVYVSYGREWLNANVDLYGLNYRSLIDILTSDYYSGAYGNGNGTDTGIEDDYFTKNAAQGTLDTPRTEETSTEGNTNIVNYLKTQYAAGAVEGDWIFFRLSIDNVDMTGSQYFKVEGGDQTNPAQLSITFSDIGGGNTAPVLAAIGNQTASEGVAKSVSITATDADGDALTFSISGNPTGVTLVDHGDKTASLEISDAVAVGIHADIVVTVSDGALEDSETISIEVAVPTDPNQKMNLDATVSERFTVTDHVWPANVGDADVCLWNDDKLAAFTITIDDNPEDDITFWENMKTTYGFNFTWFVITEADAQYNVSDWSKFVNLVNNGHAVEGHDDRNWTEPDDGTNPTDAEYLARLQATKDKINTELSTASKICKTYAYPYGEGNVVEARKIYMSIRGTFGTPNLANKVDYLDVNSISSPHITGSGKATFEEREAARDSYVLPLLNTTNTLWGINFYRGWGSTHFHSLWSQTLKDEAEELVSYLKDKEDTLWLATYPEVAAYGQSRDTHTLTIDENNASDIKFTLTDEMNDTYFDFPLTVKIRVPNEWVTVSATQNAVAVEASLVEHEGNKYVLVKAVPDAGQVTVMSTASSNIAPVLEAIGDQTATEGVPKSIAISATDADAGDALTFGISGNPTGVTLIDNGDKTASIEISDVVVVGVHSDIIITVSDGTDSNSETISITVEAAPINNAPVLATIGNQTMNTGETLTINITATDADSDPLTISVTNLPSFAEFTDNGGGTGTIVITPILGDEGTYADVVISVTDGTDTDSETITITVDKVLGISDELTFRTEVYPNPVSGNSLNVNLSKFDVSKPVMIMITDASGKVMLNKSFNGSEQVEINEIGSLQNGVYILNLKQADKQSFIRFIIER